MGCRCRRTYPTEIKADEFPCWWMFQLLAVFLRTWQLSLFDLHKLCRLFFSVAFILVVLDLIAENLLFHYIIDRHFYPSTRRPILTLHRACNFFQRVSQFKVRRSVLQIEYPSEPTITNELVICYGREEKMKKSFHSRFEIHQFQQYRNWIREVRHGFTAHALMRMSNHPATEPWSLKISNFHSALFLFMRNLYK